MAELHLLVRTPAATGRGDLTARPASITLDYLDLYGLQPSLERVRAAALQPRVASPRVLKPGEERIADFLLSCDCPILVRSAGLLNALRSKAHGALIGDFSLNAANAISAAELFGLGLSMLTPTHDLNAAQVADLARQAGARSYRSGGVIIICRYSTRSIASSAGSFPPAPAIWIAAGRARSIAWRCAMRRGASIR